MAKTSSLSLLAGVVVGIIQVTVILGCTCNVKHPQTQFKEANFVVKAKIVAKYRDQEGPDFSLPITTFTEYQVKVERIFKGKKFFNESMVAMFTPEQGSCGMGSMKPGKKYLISGYFQDNSFHLDVCSWVKQWSKLTKEQKRGLKSTYAAKCRKCNVPSVSGSELVMTISDPTRLVHPPPFQYLTSLSGLWTAEPGHCSFNPVDSWQYLGDEDCESMYTYCMKDSKSGEGCGWQINNVYKNCFIERETAWAKHEIGRRSMTGRSMRVNDMILGCSLDTPEKVFDVCLRREVKKFVTRYLPSNVSK